MSLLRSTKVLLVAFSAPVLLGCQPAPVVVDPDGDGGTTVIEERDVVIEDKDGAMPPPDSGTNVNVDVGDGKGIDVNVDRDADSNP